VVDLFGRGYSDNPTFVEHSSQLYVSQILCVIASSPISWTGSNGFAIIGYSLGGGIAASFTYHFPNLIKSLVLIAPSGKNYSSKLLSSDLIEVHASWTSKGIKWSRFN
jgi:pimeloyl-ACP methyl ester carboxylesterase